MTTDWPDIRVEIPPWAAELVARYPGPLDDATAMGVALALARGVMERGEGGPFGAVVVDAAGNLVAPGMNRVLAAGQSWAHAEMVALAVAQRRLGGHDLAVAPGAPLTLVTSGEPCAMCLGAIPWSGVARVVAGAREVDITTTGFDEGDKPAGGLEALTRRGIEIRRDVRRAEAARLLADYAAAGGTLY
ncbi:nucleoside deaminase [Thiohalospira sp.]|uniref:nucleoside deaminase n=1 Tax=Thiohalospira sp. TaxID=3080549 RepID=UPI003981694B